MKFSIGYSGAPDFIEIVGQYRDHIAEVYFAAPHTHSARRPADDGQNYIYGLRLHEDLKGLRRLGIPANMLFNALCIGDTYGTRTRFTLVCDQVAFFRDTYGVSAVTVLSAVEGRVIKKHFPDVCIHGSTNMFIRTPTQAAKIKDFVDVLTPDREINRDLDLLRDIKKVMGKPLRILANEGCIPECPHRVQHLNHVSHERPPFAAFFLPGVETYRSDPATILKSPIIRPEDVRHYEGIADTIKIASRSSPPARLARILEAYTTGGYDGDLFGLMECGCLSTYLDQCREQNAGTARGAPAFSNAAVPDDFFERTTACNRLCDTCDYCASIASRAFYWPPSTGQPV